MSGTNSRSKKIDAAEGLFGLIGITFGVIPFVRYIFFGEHGGLFDWIFGNPTSVMAYIAPLLVIAVVVAIIAVLEGVKKRS